jgi:hypothetical protein
MRLGPSLPSSRIQHTCIAIFLPNPNWAFTEMVCLRDDSPNVRIVQKTAVFGGSRSDYRPRGCVGHAINLFALLPAANNSA